jgi:hypothetical protein
VLFIHKKAKKQKSRVHMRDIYPHKSEVYMTAPEISIKALTVRDMLYTMIAGLTGGLDALYLKEFLGAAS